MEFLFNLIVKPLQLLFEFIFTNTYYTTENIILSIFILSFAVSILCLPLYLRADEIQEEENEIQKKLSKRVNSIKKNFRGDERELLLQTYYKQNNYHPIMGLRLSLSLILQVPIFMAAYTYFNSLGLLETMHFGAIKNLGTPDGLVEIFGIKINILPILMTCVSLLGTLIYAKAKNIKGSGTLVAVNLIFLALLYNSPSALVLYWLFNNLFSLIKNICLLKISRGKLIKYSLISVLIFYYILHRMFYIPLDIMVFILLGVIICNHAKIKNLNFDFNYKKLFILSMCALWVVLGVLIPSNIISTSPIEFSFQDASPINILFSTATIFAGAIIFWGLWIYYFANKTFKKLLSVCSCLILACSIINLYLAKIPLTALTNTLNFAIPDINLLLYSKSEIALYILATGISCSFILIEIFKKQRTKILINIVTTILIRTIILSAYNLSKITITTIALKKEEAKIEKKKQEKYINLSSSHKNVLIIFVDRAIGAFLPIIFKEHPELKNQYRGFIFYPNTLSFAGYTLLSYPAILGGYEYTPVEMNKSEKKFEEEYIEALSVLPKIFADNNWKTTIINPMGAEWERSLNEGVREKDLKILGKIDLNKNSNINHLKIPNHIIYNMETERKIEFPASAITKHNLVYFSLLSSAPIFIRDFIYNEGSYHSIATKKDKNNIIEDIFFLKNYAELSLLDKFTTFSEANNTFTILNNALPHHGADLSFPNYDLSSETQISYQPPVGHSEWLIRHYSVNVATIKLIGKYLDFLRANNIYDNTKIIIVADHGYIGTTLPKPLDNVFQTKNITPFNPLLLVKDFGTQENFKQSEEFMTNADVPTLATNNIIQNPKNPYTNKAINSEAKKEGVVIIKGYKWKPEFYLGKKHILNKKDSFNFVKDNPANRNNWKVDLNYKEIQKLIKPDVE